MHVKRAIEIRFSVVRVRRADLLGFRSGQHTRVGSFSRRFKKHLWIQWFLRRVQWFPVNLGFCKYDRTAENYTFSDVFPAFRGNIIQMRRHNLVFFFFCSYCVQKTRGVKMCFSPPLLNETAQTLGRYPPSPRSSRPVTKVFRTTERAWPYARVHDVDELWLAVFPALIVKCITSRVSQNN